ncbi:cytochrome c1 [Hydrogenovibrio kuenenii]|uniref:cytochrome c1 n=1 Tax=Hydrogenovibrio kuenenii TaxID=63658 RepID=UPI0004651477|nr:cytochrome c1 [Hydrogenovibrio kuenenii]
MKKQLFGLLLFLLPYISVAAEHGIQLEKANINLKDKASLQRGAILFSNYCMACHSLKYMRYNRIARDLGWTDDEIIKKMAYGQAKPVDDVMTRMLPGVAMEVLGTKVPDLSLMARLKGPDYIYTFLKGFEYDEKTKKWDNKVLHGTAMPNILEDVQRQAPKEKYDQDVRDITNFLDYVGEPIKLERQSLGWKVMLFLFIFFIITYLLKKEYWRDIKH